MGSACSKDPSMPDWNHLNANQNTSTVSKDKSLTPEQQQLNVKVLELINKNFNAKSMENWSELKNDDKIKTNGTYPSEIRTDIFIGSHRAASNQDIYNKNSLGHGITHVVNCAGSEYLKKYPSNIKVLKVCASDSINYSIIDNHIDDIIKFVQPALNDNDGNNKILFHCLAGVNRSVTLCIAYLMYEQRQTQNILDIVDLVTKKRPIGVLSNMGFVKQLVQYQSKLNQLNNTNATSSIP